MEGIKKQVKKDTLAFGEPRNVVGSEGDILDDALEVCPHCKGHGFVTKSNTSKELFTFSESTISSMNSQRVTQPPSMSDDQDLAPVPSRKSHCNRKVDRNLDEALRRSVLKLTSAEWDVKRTGLQECLQIAQNHPDEVELHMNQVYRAMRFLVTNHRARDTLFVCQVARKYFALLRSTCRPEFDELVIALLARTADSSHKVRCYVNDALDKMVTYMPTLYALRPLVEKGCQHQNHLVRTATIRLISDIVTFRTPTALLTYPYLRESCQKIVEVGAKMMVDNSSGTRAAAKDLFLKLIKHNDFLDMYTSCSIENELKKRVDRIILALGHHTEDDI